MSSRSSSACFSLSAHAAASCPARCVPHRVLAGCTPPCYAAAAGACVYDWLPGDRRGRRHLFPFPVQFRFPAGDAPEPGRYEGGEAEKRRGEEDRQEGENEINLRAGGWL
eukprot:GHVU01100591.1.p3 GENE.GHVU01100591.1~~GHVU01100591.1.p3  ORF type:complete len:110 (+),score=12.41 GHVU01100591.1:995-1324(+)